MESPCKEEKNMKVEKKMEIQKYLTSNQEAWDVAPSTALYELLGR